MLHKEFIQLDPIATGFETQIYYATASNIAGYPFYKKTTVFLHKDTATCLIKAVNLAKNLNLTFVLWDAFRPLEGQQILWNALPNPQYVSAPESGPQTHCRGTAIDLTLKDNKSEKLLNMGTNFDDMSNLSHHANTKISTTAQKNRFILAGIMHIAGFEKYEYEWWHYQLSNYSNYPVLNDNEAGTEMIT